MCFTLLRASYIVCKNGVSMNICKALVNVLIIKSHHKKISSFRHNKKKNREEIFLDIKRQMEKFTGNLCFYNIIKDIKKTRRS